MAGSTTLCRSRRDRRVVIEDAPEKVRQLFAIARRQRRQQLILYRVGHCVEPREVSTPGAGDGDHVATSVGGIGPSLDQMLCGQLVDQRDHVAAVEAATAPEVDLARRAVLVESAQHRILGTTRTPGREVVSPELLRPQSSLAEQPGRQAAEALRCDGLDGFDGTTIPGLLVMPTFR